MRFQLQGQDKIFFKTFMILEYSFILFFNSSQYSEYLLIVSIKSIDQS